MDVDLDHPVISGYLARLAAAAAGLPDWRRDELVAEIRGHLSDALATAADGDDAAMLAAVDRLGDPAEIVAAETGEVRAGEVRPGEVRPGEVRPGGSEAPDGAPVQPAWQPAPGAAPTSGLGASWGAVELVAVIGLAIGLLTGGVGLLVGLICTWISDRWTTREKVVATVVTSMLFVPLVLGLLTLAISGSSSPVVTVDQSPEIAPEVSTAPVIPGVTP
jgi:hypothetical protein